MVCCLLSLLLCASPALADDAAPPVPSFGADASVGVVGGVLMNQWLEPGIHGGVLARYDAFLTPRTVSGPRLGLSVWGGTALWPLQVDTEAGDPVHYTQYGLMTVLRDDPERPAGYVGGIGFGRLDLQRWHGAPHFLPTATLEAGVRQRLGPDGRAFLDYLVRGHWAQARAVSDLGFEEWWMVQVALAPGIRLQ